MSRVKDLNKLQKYWNYLRLGLAGLFLLLFFREICCALWYIWKTFRRFLGNLKGGQLTFPVTDFLDTKIMRVEVGHALSVLSINLAIFLVLIFIAYILIAWHVFPIDDPLKTLPIAWRLFLFTFNAQGSLVLVKDGKIIARKGDFLKYRAGIAIVDHNSAIAIERCFQEKDRRSRLKNLLFGNHPDEPSIRIAKSGIVFINRGERILNIPLDIRKQIRLEFNVNAQTRDGVQVMAITFAIFTLGQSPDVIQVTCDRKNNKVKVIEHKGGRVAHTREELSERDIAHILSYFNRKADNFRSEWWRAQIADNSSPLKPEYDNDRLLRAVKTTAKEDAYNAFQYWSDLPIQTVIKAYRNTLQKLSYDDLVPPGDIENFHLVDEIKLGFQRQMKYQGILSYQIVMHKDGRMLEQGDQWEPESLSITAPQELPHHTELRKAGVKFIFGSFGKIKPEDEIVRKQNIENWKAQKDKEIAVIRAEFDSQIRSVIQQAESTSISDSAFAIQSILENGEYNQEALAMLLLQAIKSATMKPGEDGQASKNTLRLIYSLEVLNKWFTGEEPDDAWKKNIFNLDE